MNAAGMAESAIISVLLVSVSRPCPVQLGLGGGQGILLQKAFRDAMRRWLGDGADEHVPSQFNV